ncbi:MAG: hypothetical protein L3J22_05630 [Xanthomonadales bacterium]|nr:hypothetical protein [Xanthomonadales bacterium]
MNITAYDEYVKRTKNAWKNNDEDSQDNDSQNNNRIIPDGGIVRVSMMAMDSVQRSMHDSVPTLSADAQFNLDSAQKKAAQAEAWKDHFDSKREVVEDSPRNRYIERISTAWQTRAVV